MKAFFFTLDMALALVLLVVIFSSQSDLQLSSSISHSLSPKLAGQDILNSMEKTGFLQETGRGQRSETDVRNYLNEVLPSHLSANASFVTRRFNNGDFNVVRTLNVSGVVRLPIATARRVTVLSTRDEYVFAEIVVGYR